MDSSLEREARQITEALRELPDQVQDRVREISELNTEEAAVLSSGLRTATLEGLEPLARKLLEDWDNLSVEERVTSLLMLAVALRPRFNG
jgi:hypothetical protein